MLLSALCDILGRNEIYSDYKEDNYGCNRHCQLLRHVFLLCEAVRSASSLTELAGQLLYDRLMHGT